MRYLIAMPLLDAWLFLLSEAFRGTTFRISSSPCKRLFAGTFTSGDLNEGRVMRSTRHDSHT